jgi:hypothetical protein
MIKELLDRRTFFKGASIGLAGLSAANLSTLHAQVQGGAAMDVATQIFTAALIAEDLATTFYYNGLVGGVIQDVSLAGPGGSIAAPSPTAQGQHLKYVQAALTQEIAHATLLRSLLKISGAAADPVQTFYFPKGTFDTLTPFLATLDALENAFIGAYLSAVREFAYAAVVTAKSGQGSYVNSDGTHGYTSDELQYFSQVCASIMAIESEHRALGRTIGGSNPSNNLTYAQLAGIGSVYNGPASAVVALTPFLTPSTGQAYSLATALANQSTVSAPSTGTIPAF